MSSFEHLVRKAFNRMGLDLTRYRPEQSHVGRLVAMLSHHRANVVLDVGANTGQFASGLRQGGYAGRIVSFEPLADAHARLTAASRRDPGWTVAPRAAVGASSGEVELNVSGNSVSSSLLPMMDTHSTAAPASRFVARETVPIDTLDALSAPHLRPGDVPFLKIDTQGFEDRVLDGAGELLRRACGVQLEMSLVPLYEGQVLFGNLAARMHALGYATWAIWPGFHAPDTGRMLQVDAAFFRE